METKMKKIAKSKSGVYGTAAIFLISGVRSLIIGDENYFFWMVCFIFVLSLIDLMRAKDKMTSLLYWMLIASAIVLILCIWSFASGETVNGITYGMMTIMIVHHLVKQFKQIIDSTDSPEDC